MKLLAQREYENIKEFIYRTLKYNIMTLFLKPGEKISESELQNFFNTSKSPIREALVKLKEEKLVEAIPQKGTFISKINLKLVENTLFIRKVLEKEVLRLVILSSLDKRVLIEKLNENLLFIEKIIKECTCNEKLVELFNLDKQFHEIIFKFVDKGEIWDIISSSSTHYERFRVLETPEQKTLLFILKQHRRIIELIKNGDVSLIEETITLHGENFLNSCNTLLTKYNSYFLTEEKKNEEVVANI